MIESVILCNQFKKDLIKRFNKVNYIVRMIAHSEVVRDNIACCLSGKLSFIHRTWLPRDGG